MEAGRLNARVAIKHLAAGQDAIGQPVPTWSVLAVVWANIRHRSGAEAIKSGAEISLVQASIRIRRRADVTAGMRVEHGADAYDIKAVLASDSRAHCDLVCEKVV